MKSRIALLLLLGFAIVGGVTSSVLMQSAVSEIAFVNVNVIPMTSREILRGQTVVVRGDRVVQIGAASKIRVSDGARRIDGSGKYLMPGLAEMHGHIPPPQASAAYTESVLFLYLANGITTVRGMLGAPNQLLLRDRANKGELLSPTLYLAGPSFNGNSVKSAAQAVEMVREQKQQGWDLLKVHPGLTLEQYDAMAKTAKEVGIRFSGHVPADVGLWHALEMGQETIDHVDGYVEHLKCENSPVDEAKLKQIVQKTKQMGAWVVPTMAIWETVIGAADLEKMTAYLELKYMPPQQVTAWKNAVKNITVNPQFNRKQAETTAANRLRILKALHEGGVRILFGTDSPQMFSVPGFSINREIPFMQKSGLTPYEIIQSGTKNVGDYFKAKDSFGTIEVGKRADMILINGNPLEDLSNLAMRTGVMARGRWLSEAEIQDRLNKLAASYEPAK